MWDEVGLPYIFERMLEFSIPIEDQILIVSYDGMHHVRLAPTMEVAHFPEHREGDGLVFGDDVEHVRFGGVDFPMLGLEGGTPILDDPRRGHRLSLDLAGERLRVVDGEARVVQEIAFYDLSGDWGFATYSADGKWLAIGVPYDLFLYRWCEGVAR
jgi:hypothetical protein